MADPSVGPASFWTQANALLRKNLTYQVFLISLYLISVFDFFMKTIELRFCDVGFHF